MPTAAVLGFPIKHSLSPVLHNAGYAACQLEDWLYTRHEAVAEDIPDILDHAPAHTRGFSVTMPAKRAALDAAHVATDRARLIGSANTLVRNAAGWWIADNTDCDGMTGALATLGLSSVPRRASILGAGGTARASLYSLARAGVERITIVNRSNRAEEYRHLVESLTVDVTWTTWDTAADDLETPDLVVSTVPSAVVEPWVGAFAVAPTIDVIYHPWPTPLVTTARARGLPAIGGLSMLAHQAFSQFEQFTGTPAPQEAMVRALVEATRQPLDEIMRLSG